MSDHSFVVVPYIGMRTLLTTLHASKIIAISSDTTFLYRSSMRYPNLCTSHIILRDECIDRFPDFPDTSLSDPDLRRFGSCQCTPVVC
jgi:hypothetical protein